MLTLVLEPDKLSKMINLSASFSTPFLTLFYFLGVIGTAVLTSSESEFGGIIDSNNKATKEKHLNVIPFHLPPSLFVRRNTTGHVVQVTGPVNNVLEFLSRGLHFRYSFLNDNLNRIESTPSSKGMVNYLLDGQADMILGIVALTAERLQKMNFPHPCVMDGFVVLIPMPKSTTNLAAVLQPFQPLVWILIPVSVFLAIVALWWAGRAVFAVERQKEGGIVNPEDKRKGFISLNQAFTFVVSMLLSQGLQINSGEMMRQRKIGIRCLAASWALTVFFLTTAYSSVLTSFITSPNYMPIINSIYDLTKKTEIQINSVKGQSPNVLLTNAENGIGKFVGDMFRKNPKLECNERVNCVEMVRNQENMGFTSVRTAVLNIIGQNLNETHRCDFTVAKESYWPINSGIALSKNISDMLEGVNINIMRMHEAGLIEMWMFKSLTTDPTRCLNPPEVSSTPRLSLAGLSGAFVILLTGIFISICLFIGECLF